MKQKIIIISIVVLIFSLIVFTYYSYAFYSSEASGSEYAKVANFSLSIDEPEAYFSYDLGDINPTSSTQYYKFNIVNINDNKVSEVDLKYVLNFITTRNLPLNIEVYQVNKEVYDATTNNKFDSTNAELIQNVVYPNSVNIEDSNTFKASVLSNYYYVIKVSWNSDSKYKSSIYHNKIDLFKVNVNFEQIS